MQIRRDRIPAYCLAVVAAAAFLLRLGFAPSKLPYLHDWDEPLIASRALAILKTGDFNPRVFYYGSLLTYLNLAVDALYVGLLRLHLLRPSVPLPSLGALRTFLDSGWEWTVSHPDFFLWNRGLTALLGAGTVVAVYFLGAEVFNPWTGLIAAGLLAVTPYHALQSALVTPNVPAALFMVAAVLFSARFLRGGLRRDFLLALVASGLAFAVKYNAGAIAAAPLAARIRVGKSRREAVRPYDWILLPLVPLLIFLVTTPYALLDFSEFRGQVLYVSRAYLLDGHPGFSVRPGWPHFLFQMRQLLDKLGGTTLMVAGLGLAALAARPRGLEILAGPAAYTLLMACTRVSFHRNLVAWYPWAAFLFAAGIDAIQRFALAIGRRRGRLRTILSAPAGIVAAIVILSSAGSSWLALRASEAPETRSRAVELVNRLPGVGEVIVARELRLHELDLARLAAPHRELPLERIVSRFFGEGAVYLLPSALSWYPTDPAAEREGAALQRRYAPFRSALRPRGKVICTVGTRRTSLNIPSIDPAVVIAGGIVPPAACAAIPGELDPAEFAPATGCAARDDTLRIGPGGRTRTPAYLLPAGAYRIRLEGRALGGASVRAALKIAAVAGRDGSPVRSGERLLGPEWSPIALPFRLDRPRPVAIVLSSNFPGGAALASRKIALEEDR